MHVAGDCKPVTQKCGNKRAAMCTHRMMEWVLHISPCELQLLLLSLIPRVSSVNLKINGRLLTDDRATQRRSLNSYVIR